MTKNGTTLSSGSPDLQAQEFYQRLMLCYHSSGGGAEALAVYDRCRETLSRILGVEPSQETETIYATLTKEK